MFGMKCFMADMKKLHISFATEMLREMGAYDENKSTKSELYAITESEYGNCVALLTFTPAGYFKVAVVFEPGRWHHCILEGLTEDQALDEATRYVTDFSAVRNFLLRKPYNWNGKKSGFEQLLLDFYKNLHHPIFYANQNFFSSQRNSGPQG